MCSVVSMVSLFASVALVAHPAAAPSRPSEQKIVHGFDISAATDQLGHDAPMERAPLLDSPDHRWSQPLRITGVTFGIERGPSRITGDRARYANVRFDEATILGGNIGASVDGRSARLTLSWAN